jgi:sugar lactone lactonase YvrE
MELILDGKAALGEGAIWDSRRRRLYWVDIAAGDVHLFDPVTGADRSLALGQSVGTVVPSRGGALLVAMHHGFARLDPESGALTPLCDPERDRPDNRFNDGKCDPAGRFWAGTISMKREQGVCALYRLDADLTVTRMVEGVTNSNGICWSLDAATLYYIDTPTGRVDAFDYDVGTGAIANRRPAIVVPAELGHPDGMTIDAEGMLWVCLWNGWGVSRWNPATGERIGMLQVPASQVTSCAFGGPDLRDLYITTARKNIAETDLTGQPHAGGLFRARPDVRGIPAFEFDG